MKQISGNVQILLYLLGALVLAIFSFSMAIGVHQDQVKGTAQVPRYKADCSGALWYSPATPSVPCYDVETYVVLTNHRGKSFDHYTAELTLPNGNDVTGDLKDEPLTTPVSGSYTAEIWHGKLTQILVKNQTLRTFDNPTTTRGGYDGATEVAIPIVAGVVAMLFVILFSAVLVKGFQNRQ